MKWAGTPFTKDKMKDGYGIREWSHGCHCQNRIRRMGTMIKHYITKYTENGKRYAEAWIQINFFGKCFCVSRKRIFLGEES